MFTCGVCHGDDGREELVEEVFSLDGRFVLVGGVPSTVCQRCGERSFSRRLRRRCANWFIMMTRRRIPCRCRYTNLHDSCGKRVRIP